MGWKKILCLCAGLVVPSHETSAQESSRWFSKIIKEGREAKESYDGYINSRNIRNNAEKVRKGGDAQTRAEAAVDLGSNLASAVYSMKGGLKGNVADVVTKLSLSGPIGASVATRSSMGVKTDMTASPNDIDVAKLESMESSEMASRAKAGRSGLPVIAALHPNATNLKAAAPVVQEQFAGFTAGILQPLYDAFAQKDLKPSEKAKQKTKSDLQPVQPVPELTKAQPQPTLPKCGTLEHYESFESGCQPDQPPKKEETDTGGEMGWTVKGYTECMPLPADFKSFVNSDLEDGICKILQTSEQNGTLIYLSRCPILSDHPELGSIMKKSEFSIVGPKEIQKVETYENGDSSTLTYVQCKLSPQNMPTAGMDCSAEGKAAYRAANGGSSPGYMCENPE